MARPSAARRGRPRRASSAEIFFILPSRTRGLPSLNGANSPALAVSAHPAPGLIAFLNFRGRPEPKTRVGAGASVTALKYKNKYNAPQ